MKTQKRKQWMQRKKNESEIKYLGFLCVLLQCMCEAEKEAWAERWRWRWRWRRKRRRTFTCEMGRLTERPVRNNTSSSEWHQAVGMNIIKQKCRVMGDQVQFKVEGIHQVSVRKVSFASALTSHFFSLGSHCPGVCDLLKDPINQCHFLQNSWCIPLFPACFAKSWEKWLTYLCFGCRESWSICRAVALSCSAKYLQRDDRCFKTREFRMT